MPSPSIETGTTGSGPEQSSMGPKSRQEADTSSFVDSRASTDGTSTIRSGAAAGVDDDESDSGSHVEKRPRAPSSAQQRHPGRAPAFILKGQPRVTVESMSGGNTVIARFGNGSTAVHKAEGTPVNHAGSWWEYGDGNPFERKPESTGNPISWQEGGTDVQDVTTSPDSSAFVGRVKGDVVFGNDGEVYIDGELQPRSSN